VPHARRYDVASVERKAQLVFLCLVLAQAAHSVEECFGRLYEVFAPARAVSLLVSDDPALGFLIANSVVVGFGLWCWAFPIRRGWPSARGFAWFWTVLEMANGINHLGMALLRGAYFPGAATAPLLLFFAGWLAAIQVRPGERRTAVGS
jgi:hypothetical protein